MSIIGPSDGKAFKRMKKSLNKANARREDLINKIKLYGIKCNFKKMTTKQLTGVLSRRNDK